MGLSRTSGRPFLGCSVVVALALVGAAAPGVSTAGLFSHATHKPKTTQANSAAAAALAAQVEQALDEQRNLDAGNLLDEAATKDLKSPALTRLGGELLLARGNYADAIDVFRLVETNPAEKAKALAGEGIAYSMLSRSDDALVRLKQAVELDKSLWRAWNGLGREYDIRHDWTHSADAYEHAMAAPGEQGGGSQQPRLLPPAAASGRSGGDRLRGRPAEGSGPGRRAPTCAWPWQCRVNMTAPR